MEASIGDRGRLEPSASNGFLYAPSSGSALFVNMNPRTSCKSFLSFFASEI